MEINFNTQGLVPAIVQDEHTKTVLMLGYMNQEAVSKTLETKRVTFYSRKHSLLCKYDATKSLRRARRK